MHLHVACSSGPWPLLTFAINWMSSYRNSHRATTIGEQGSIIKSQCHIFSSDPRVPACLCLTAGKQHRSLGFV